MHPTRITGIVLRGRQLGRTLGYPTANQKLHEQQQDIADGVYVSRTAIEGEWHGSLTFIGAPETFEDSARKVETFIFDFDRDIYDMTIEVDLLDFQRPSVKFNSAEELIDAMHADEAQARKALASHPEWLMPQESGH